jgi:hypothetical protein
MNIKIDTGSLTGPEYEEIYYALNSYCLIANNINEPIYVREVRMANIERLRKIMDKMHKRMTIDYPPNFV